MKKILLIMLLVAPAWGASQKRSVQVLGLPWGNSSAAVMTTTPLNTVSSFTAFGIVPSTSGSITAFNIYVSTVSGAPAALDFACDFYGSSSDGLFIPTGFITRSTATVAPATLTRSTCTFTPGIAPVVAGTQYFMVIHNLDASPATINFTLRSGAATDGPAFSMGGTSAGNPMYGWSKRLSPDSGSTWVSSSQNAAMGPRVDYADGTSDGIVISTINVPINADRVYASSATGIRFTTPPFGNLNLAGVSINPFKAGSPTGNIAVVIYNGTTPLATTYALVPGYINTSPTVWMWFYFPSDVQLVGNTTYRLAIIQENGSLVNTAAYGLEEYWSDLDPISLNLLPWNVEKTKFDGNVWTDTIGVFSKWNLLLDTNGEFFGGTITTTPGSGQIIIK